MLLETDISESFDVHNCEFKYVFIFNNELYELYFLSYIYIYIYIYLYKGWNGTHIEYLLPHLFNLFK